MTRRGLDRNMIAQAALALIDRDGLDALTMRALASELGVEAPSLYKHATGKDDILDGVLDIIYRELWLDPSDDPWQDRVRAYSRALRATMLAHPNAAPVMATRPVFGAETLSLLERVLGELYDMGLDATRSIFVCDVVVSYVMGHVLSQLSADPNIGADPDELARLRSMLPPDRFPRVRETLGNGPVDRDAEFELGLDLIVAGLEHMLTRAPALRATD